MWLNMVRWLQFHSTSSLIQNITKLRLLVMKQLSRHYQWDLGMLSKNLKCDLLKRNNEC
jgi:hypothetical protein